MPKIIHPKRIPAMVYANEAGEILDIPGLNMAGRAGSECRTPSLSELIPMPPGSELFVLPQRHPVGIDPETGSEVDVKEDPFAAGSSARAVSAFIAPAHTSVLTTAFKKTLDEAQVLPLFAYTAVGWLDGRFWVSAFRSDPNPRHDCDNYNVDTVKKKTDLHRRKFPANRLIQHLAECCLTYNCPNARNYFLGRWEAPLPTSPHCNADCAGCISLQPSGCCPSPQERISFVPAPDDIAEIAVSHIAAAPKPVVSFGQGCEGEPLLQAHIIERAIKKIRGRTSGGTINLNTNASMPDMVARLARAGLDSMRVSMNSARKEKHALYYRPRGFSLDEAKASISIMKQQGKFVSLNYFVLPGFTDDHEEMSAFFGFIEECMPDLVQLRNLNMDPDRYFETVCHNAKGIPIGILNWLGSLRTTFPNLKVGYFNPYLGQG